MSKASEAANGLMLAVAQVAALFDVPAFRQQSRTFNVVGAGGRMRPMFTGEWTDDLGVKHRKGMADWLLMPRVRSKMTGQIIPNVPLPPNMQLTIVPAAIGITVPLFVECKSLGGRMEPDQKAFKTYVEAHGAYHLLIHDDANELIVWFEEHGVKK